MDTVSEQLTRDAFRRRNGDYEDPGATKIWFGMHKGKRLDKLDEEYRRVMLRIRREGPKVRSMIKDVCISTSLPQMQKADFYAEFDDFKIIHDRFVEKLDEKQSPMSTIIWFGKYKGHEIRQHYNASRRWEWFVAKNIVWKPDLEEIEARFEKWLEKRPARKTHTSRSAPNIINPRGKLLGRWDDDDDPPPTNESYQRDSFCVSEDEERLDDNERAASQKIEESNGVESEAGDYGGRNLPPLRTDSAGSTYNGQESSARHSTLERLKESRRTHLALHLEAEKEYTRSLAILATRSTISKRQAIQFRKTTIRSSHSSELDLSDKENGTTRFPLHHGFAASSLTKDPNEKTSLSRKGKYVAMANLSQQVSQSERNRPKASPLTKKPTPPRNKRPPPKRKTSSEPDSNNATPSTSSGNKQQRCLTSYFQRSSEAAPLQESSSEENIVVDPAPKRRKRGTQVPANVAAYILR